MTDHRLRDALKWYRLEAIAASKAVLDKKNPDAMLATLTVLALDGGKRADAALSAPPIEPVGVRGALEELCEFVKVNGVVHHDHWHGANKLIKQAQAALGAGGP